MPSSLAYRALDFWELPCVTDLKDLQRAVGRWPWRIRRVRTSSAKPISREMTLLLALVIFDGYELFPALPEKSNDTPRKSATPRHVE